MISFIIYFLPTIIALIGRRKSSLPIFMTNLILGWTGIFWVFTLVWSLLGDSRYERN